MPSKHSSISIAILSRAPLPGQAKTRLIPALGAQGAADLHWRFLLRTVQTAFAAQLGPVNLWCTPDQTHPAFAACQQLGPLSLHTQGSGDLGERMLATLAANTPTLIIGTDCPALKPEHLQQAAAALRRDSLIQKTSFPRRRESIKIKALDPRLRGDDELISTSISENDAVLIPAEDGGYVLIGLRQPEPALFTDMTWGCATVLEHTRHRLRTAGLRWVELPTLWDVDEPADLTRLATFAPELLTPI